MTKKLFKKVRLLMILFLIITVSTFLSIRIWLDYRFDSVVNGLDYKTFSQDIKNTNELPANLYTAYSKVFNYSQNTSTNDLLLKTPFRVLGLKSPNCPCVEVNYGFVLSYWDRLSVGIQLDKDVGSKKCMGYYLNNFDFLYGQIGVKNASNYYFNKPLNKLSENELIELCIMTKNPIRFNKKEHPEELNKELLKIIE